MSRHSYKFIGRDTCIHLHMLKIQSRTIQREIESSNSDFSSTDAFDPLNIAPHRCEILVACVGNDDIIFNPYSSHRLVLFQHVVVDVVRLADWR